MDLGSGRTRWRQSHLTHVSYMGLLQSIANWLAVTNNAHIILGYCGHRTPPNGQRPRHFQAETLELGLKAVALAAH
jgi:hypothetical protein